MRIISGVVFIIAAGVLCGCSSIKGRSGSLAIDFEELTVAGIKPGEPEESVVEKLGHPYDIWSGRADSKRELWTYYDMGIKVILDKESREVEEIVTYLNRYQAYRPFRGSIVQGFPLASRLVRVKPMLEGYAEVKTMHKGYETVQVYDDSAETDYMKKEFVRLERDDGAKMTVYFDYDEWMERITLGRGESREEMEPQEAPGEEIVVEEPEAG